ncbi:MAG TPA: hypothetical protein VF714_00595 [Jatrophihabitans sp.]|jgi:hypothetical protein
MSSVLYLIGYGVATGGAGVNGPRLLAHVRAGGPEDVLRYIDGVLLVDLWNELVLPPDVRAAWWPVIDPLITAHVADPASA